MTLRFKNSQFWVLVIVACGLLYFSVLPLFLLILKSVGPSHVQNYLEIIEKKSNWKALLNTLTLSSLTTLVTVLIGLPLAWLLAKTDLPFKNMWKSLYTIPYIIPPYIGAIAWIKLCNPTSGILNEWMKTYLGLTASIFNIYSLSGAVFVLSIFFYSFILLSCRNAFEKIDPVLEEAGRMCGANRFQVLRQITLPLMTPALMAGMILVFMATAASFGVPALLLMPHRIFVLTTKIYTDILNYTGGIEKAVSLSVLLMFVGLIGLWLSQLFLRNKRYTTISGKYTQPHVIELGSWKWPLMIGLSVFWAIIVCLPILTTAISSMSLKKYAYVLFDLDNTRHAFLNSFVFATLASTVAMVIGSLLAYLSGRSHVKGQRWLTFLVTLPYATPGTVVAIGLIIAFSGFMGLNLYNTAWILIAAYVVKYISFAVQNTQASLHQMDVSLEEAARMSGASWVQALWTIMVPILKPTLMASWFLIFMPTFSELTMSVLLVGPKTDTIGTLLFNLQSFDDPRAASVLATVIVIVLLSSNLIVKKLSKEQYGV